MKFRKLGSTDIDVSTVCLGCWALIGGGTWGPQDRDDSRATIRAALDAGVTFFDTAEGYGSGESEALLGEVLGPHRSEVVLASKVGRRNLRPDALKAHCEESLRALATDYMDLYQIHWPDPDVPLAETVGAMQDLKAEGKIRAIGVSNFGAGYLGEALEVGPVASNQVCYNLLFQAVEFEVEPLASERGVSILPYSPLAQGLLTGKFRTADNVPEGRARTRHFSKDRPEARHQEPGCEEEVFATVDRIRAIAAEVDQPMSRVALAWLLAQPGVVSVIAGARNPDQVHENVGAGDLKLPPDVLARLSDATDPVKQALGRNIDAWQTDSRAERP